MFGKSEKRGAQLLRISRIPAWAYAVFGGIGVLFAALLYWNVRTNRDDYLLLRLLSFALIGFLCWIGLSTYVFENGIDVWRNFGIRPLLANSFKPWVSIRSYFWDEKGRLVIDFFDNLPNGAHSAQLFVPRYQRAKMNEILLKYLPGKRTAPPR